MPTYRTLRSGEWPEAMTLWVQAFGEVGWIFDTLDAGTPDRKLEHTLIAEDQGKIVGAVDVFMREVRDENGDPVKIGGIGSVATDAEYRRQGISGHLLTAAIDLMGREGCGWSMLFAGYLSHYRRWGWECTPWKQRVCSGLRDTLATSNYEIEALGNEGPWPLAEMAGIYDSFNDDRPMSHVRAKQYWQTPIRVRLERPERRVWLARSNGNVVGYLVATAGDDALELIEIGYLPESESAAPELIAAAVEQASGSVVFRLPHERIIDHSLREMFEEIVEEDQFGPMARSISSDWPFERIVALMALPRACSWELDAF